MFCRFDDEHLISAPLAHSWPAVSLKQESFSNSLTHGPEIAPLLLDPGSNYVLVKSESDKGNELGLTSLVSIPTGFLHHARDGATLFGSESYLHYASNQSWNGSESQEPTRDNAAMEYSMDASPIISQEATMHQTNLHSTHETPVDANDMRNTGRSQMTSTQQSELELPLLIIPAGSHPKITQQHRRTLTAASVQGTLALEWDPNYTVSEQFGGTTMGTVDDGTLIQDHIHPGGDLGMHITNGVQDFLKIGPQHATLLPLSAYQTQAQIGLQEIGAGNTLPELGMSRGIASQPGVGATGHLPGKVFTVIHPLDAYPVTRRIVAEEKRGQMLAEKYRKQISGKVIRRDYITMNRYPRGVLGVDSPSNPESAIYGELAQNLQHENYQQATLEKMREEHIRLSNDGYTRRGYNLLEHWNEGKALKLSEQEEMMRSLRNGRNDTNSVIKSRRNIGGALPSEKVTLSARLDPKDVALRNSAKWEVQNKDTFPHRGKMRGYFTRPSSSDDAVYQQYPALSVDTYRSVGQGEIVRPSRRNLHRAQDLINYNTNGRKFNPITNRALDEKLMPSIPEKKGYWRHAHPSIVLTIDPLKRGI